MKMINENDIAKDLGKKYIEIIETDEEARRRLKDELRKKKERERNKNRREYQREWERKNRKIHGIKFFNKKEAEIILKFLPNRDETKDLIEKVKRILGLNKQTGE